MPARPDLLTNHQLNRATLARQMLLERADISAAMGVERLIGMQAQEPKPPFIGLWSRLKRFRREDLHASLHDRATVRGTLMRGTIHYFGAQDYLAYRLALQPMLTRALEGMGARAANLDLERVVPAAHDLLEQQPLTFGELRPLLAARFPEMDERLLGYAARVHLPLIMLPTADRWSFPANARFALAEPWLRAPLHTEENRPALVRRYLAAFGPASVPDVQTWSGLKGLKPILEALRPELLAFRDERGRELFDLPDAPRPAADVPAPPRFLPEFDNLLLSHANRTRVIADEHRAIVYQKGNLRLLATILVDGVVAGLWRVERQRKTATLRITPFSTVAPATMAALQAEGEALLRFIEDDATAFEIIIST